MLSVVFDSLALHTDTTGPYIVQDPGPDWGSQAVADVLLTGQYRLEEYDQIAAGLTRTVTLPLKIRSASADALVTDQQAITSRVAAASRYVPKTLSVTPLGSTHVSTMKVFGGSWTSDFTQISELTHTTSGVLTLVCDWPVWGATQNLGSSGSPLITNQASPAAVTLSPSPLGDVLGDVTVFFKNRAGSAIRSAIIGCVSGDTTWVAGSDQSTWTLDTNGARSGGLVFNSVAPFTAGQVMSIAHFTAPTLPADRRFRVYLRASHHVADSDSPLFRIRLVSGSTQIPGPWRSLPQETSVSARPGLMNAADMGAYTFPIGSVGQLGAQSTVIYIETTQTVNPVAGDEIRFAEALFAPDSSTLTVETGDTSQTLAAAAGITRVETDQAYSSSGNPAGGVVVGSHIRSLGGRYNIYTSQGFMASLDTSLPWAPESVDAWATYQPRYIGLA